MIRNLIFLVMISLVSVDVSSQSFGIRAGLNYTSFSGPVESGVNEKYNISNGFHFGINYGYNFADYFTIRGEIVYTQVGSGYSYDGESFYKVPLGNAFLYEKGRSTIEMKISNAYISVPMTLQWQVTKKLEVSAGVYASYLIGPRGNGTIYFEKNKDSLFFKQSLIHNYFKDTPGGIANSAPGATVWVDGIVVTLAKDAGAYYNYLVTEKDGSLYNRVDFGITGGVSYFINKGFYFGLRYDYGLLDITNNKMDFLRKTYDTSTSRGILSNHFDRNVGFQASFGFRF